MKKVFVSNNLIEVEGRKELFDLMTIPCMIKNQRSAMLGGEIPFVEVFPELWVLDDRDFEKAITILDDWESATTLGAMPWTCSRCGEVHRKEFTACWKCGKEKY